MLAVLSVLDHYTEAVRSVLHGRPTELFLIPVSKIFHQLEREREMFYLTTHSTHFIYGYMASDMWLRTILIVRNETRCHHIGYSYRLAARVLLYAPSHRQDNTYHGLCYTSRGALAGSPVRMRMSKISYTTQHNISVWKAKYREVTITSELNLKIQNNRSHMCFTNLIKEMQN